MAIGLLVYRGFYFRAFDSSGILQSGFLFIGEFVIGVLVYRGFGYRAFDLSGFCYRANGHRAFGYRPYVVLPFRHILFLPRFSDSLVLSIPQTIIKKVES